MSEKEKLTWRDFETLTIIYIKRIDRPILISELSFFIGLRRTDSYLIKIRKILIENHLAEERCGFKNNKVIIISMKRLSRFIRNSHYFKHVGKFIEKDVWGFNY